MKKILILEDEEIIGRIYANGLKDAGFQVRWETTTNGTLETAQKFYPDIILLDHAIRDEEQSGLDIIPELKKMLPDASIIMLSNYSHTQIEKTALGLGAIGYLIKLETTPTLLVDYVNNLFV
jgi:DNA-binding response OmpR family regulator